MNQLTRGKKQRLLYFENKDGSIDGYSARIGWASFSKTGKTIYYRGRAFARIKGGGVSGNYYCDATGDEYWISGVKKSGSNAHWAESVEVFVDEDAVDEYQRK